MSYKPDASKVLRAVEDALTGIVYADDCQITDEFISMRWAEEDLTVIEIWW